MKNFNSVFKNLKHNKIYKLLTKNKLIKKENLSIFHFQTRDKKNLKSFIDKSTNIIFLEKTKKVSHYYNKKTNKYGEKFIKTHYGKFKTSFPDDLKRRINQFRNFIKNKNILDFGCGSGDFLHESKNILQQGVGIEMDFTKIKYSDSKKIKFLKNINQINQMNIKFDSIFLFHVFEHLENPIEILIQLKSKLKKNGTLIIEVPHANDLLLNKLKIKSFVNFSLWSEHLILHTKKSLKCFLNNAGFYKNKIIFYQRYNFNNHIGWITYDKGGGHNFLKNLCDKAIVDQYNDILIKKEYTDTIYSISKNL